MKCLRIYVVAAALLLDPTARALAEGYWASAYQDFEVVTADRAARAVSLAHNVARFEKALTENLNLPPASVPTHIYELPPKETKDLLGGADGAAYHFTGYEVAVVTGVGVTKATNPNWGPLFGYTGSLLFSRTGRYPYWYLIGIPQLFANTEFGPGEIKTGGMSAGFAYTLTRGKLIPMRVFLRAQRGDPQLQSASEFRTMFEAESWFLAREVFVERKLRSEFGQYLKLIVDGKSEEEAFSASFKISYEDLDKVLLKAMSEPAHLFVVKVPTEPPDSAQARQLSPAEVKARLADLSLTWNHRADAQRLASEALQQDAANELALRTMARVSLSQADFAAALANAERLLALPSPSAAALTDCGEVFARLAFELAAKHATLATDPESLRGRAKDAYERAVGTDPEYLRAWAGLAYLYSTPNATAAAQALVPRAQPVMEKHPYNGALARALATMCAQTGQTSSAFLFGELWRNGAPTEKDRSQAETFLARLQTR